MLHLTDEQVPRRWTKGAEGTPTAVPRGVGRPPSSLQPGESDDIVRRVLCSGLLNLSLGFGSGSSSDLLNS